MGKQLPIAAWVPEILFPFAGRILFTLFLLLHRRELILHLTPALIKRGAETYKR